MNDVKKFWKPLEQKISALVEQQTKNCIRAKKMTVTEAPNGAVIGVAEAYGPTIYIPYSSSLASAAVNSGVWCIWMANDLSTLAAMWPGELA